MASKNLLIHLNIIYFITILIHLSLIYQTKSLSFKYPTALSLKNGNIFVIHSLGIDICDNKYITSINKVTFDNEINEQTLSKISISKYSNDEFLVFIINKFYLFDVNGNIKIIATPTDSYNGEYYSLSSYKIVPESDIDYYYFLLGYIDIDSYNYLKLFYYSINTASNEATKLVSKNFNDDIRTNGISCQFLFYSSKDYIMCLYQSSYYTFTIFEFTTNSIEYSTQSPFALRNIKIIKSSLKDINSKILFCNLDNGGNNFCIIYDIYDFYFRNENGNPEIYRDTDYSKKCMIEPFNIKTYYFQETGEYVFSCLTDDNGIQTTIYDKNMAHMSEIKIPRMRLLKEISGCEKFYYSIIYSQYYKRYFIISDIDCNNHKKFFPLIEEEIIIIEEEEEEEENKYFEEEENYEINILEEENDIFNNKEIEKELIKEFIEEEKEILKTLFEEEKEIELTNFIKYEEEKLEEKNEMESESYIESKEKESKNLVKEEEEMKEEPENILKEKEQEEEKEMLQEKEKYYCILEKCEECTEESINLNLCKKCNTKKHYYPLIIESENFLSNHFIECYNETTKPLNFYLDKENSEYKICHLNCKTCLTGGDGNQNNCTSCKDNQIFKPDFPSSNCVPKCDYFYYYQNGQYKCTSKEICPTNYPLEITDKKKCIEKCLNDIDYKYQYDGECYKDTPQGTTYDTINKISKDIDINKCILKEKILRLENEENITETEIEQKAKLYAKEFNYTNEHVTIYKNNIYMITLYKDGNCLPVLQLTIDEIDFGICYNKIQNEFNINDKNLIIVIISKIINNILTTIDKFIFNPITGEKIIFTLICKDDTLTVKKDLKEQMKNDENIKSLEELAEQGINIFNPNDDFYTDLCFHFKSPINGKDIPLKDRLKLFFPNITLCDQGCFTKGVNLTTFKSICQCALNDLINNDFLGNNVFLQQSLGEFTDILTKTNIEVLKCYKDVFNKNIYKNNTGFIIVIVLITVKLVMIFIYYYKSRFIIKKYVMGLTDKFIIFLSTQKKNNNSIVNYSNRSNPPKKEEFIEIKEDKKLPKITKRKKKGKNQINKFIELNNRKNSNDIIDKSDEFFEEKIEDTVINNIENDNNLNINIQDYIETDLDEMDYDDAIRKDKRKFCQYFYSRIINDQIILSTFLNQEILKPLPVKIILLILNIDLYFIINGLFFNENYISELLNQQKETFSSIINRILDRIVIITITGVIINYIIEFFFVEENKIRGVFKREKNNLIILKYEIVQIIKNTYKKYNIFIIISGIIMIFSLYYSFCFNNVYPSIKGEWIKSSIIIIVIMQILPIIICLMYTSIRFISFKCKSERLFKLSSFLI